MPPPTPWLITSRGPNENILQQTNYEVSPSGEVVARLNTYKAIATGLNHWSNGQWIPSSQTIDILANGSAEAIQGQHQVIGTLGDMLQGMTKMPQLTKDWSVEGISTVYSDILK